MNLVKLLKIAAVLRPILSELIADAEALIPEGGKGSAKLAAVKAGLQALWSGLAIAGAGSLDEAWPEIQAIISSMVAIRNALGLFKSLPKIGSTAG